MISKRLKETFTPTRDPYGPAPQQMTLFPEEKTGVNVERMKIKTLLKAFYKGTDDSYKRADGSYKNADGSVAAGQMG